MAAIRAGNLQYKPGWVRLSVHPTMTDAKVNFIMDAIEETVLNFRKWSEDYVYDEMRNEYVFKGVITNLHVDNWFNTETWHQRATIHSASQSFVA